MIEAFTLRTAHKFGDALASQARLRHRVFVEQRQLDHRSFDGMEYDEFDTPGAVYFVWRDDQQIVRGLLRLLPTTIPYMTQVCWPQLVRGELPVDPQVREVTRICVDRSVDSYNRIRIFPKLLCALHAYCDANGIKSVVGVTREHLIQHFIRNGIIWLGSPGEVEGQVERAFQVPLDYMLPRYHCGKFGLTNRVLTLEPISQVRTAA